MPINLPAASEAEAQYIVLGQLALRKYYMVHFNVKSFRFTKTNEDLKSNAYILCFYSKNVQQIFSSDDAPDVPNVGFARASSQLPEELVKDFT